MVDFNLGLKTNIINTRLIQKWHLNQHHPLPYTLQNFGREPVNPIGIYYITFKIINATGYTRAIT